MPRQHWEYYLTLIDDIERLARYIEPNEKNANTFSIELVRLLLSTGSEIDVVCKVLCKMVDPNDNARTIDQYRKQLMALFSPMPHIRITAPKYGLEFTPWDAWKDDKNPTWWHGYNKVKHERDSFFEHATLWNVLNAAAGLCVMIGYLYRQWFENHTVPRPILFFSDDYKGKGFAMMRSSVKLP